MGNILPFYMIDGNLVSFAEARELQWTAKEMHTIYFNQKYGNIIKISKRSAGDY